MKPKNFPARKLARQLRLRDRLARDGANVPVVPFAIQKTMLAEARQIRSKKRRV